MIIIKYCFERTGVLATLNAVIEACVSEVGYELSFRSAPMVIPPARREPIATVLSAYRVRMQMTAQIIKTKGAGTLDGYGAFASTICALHCAACALLPATLTTLGLVFLIGHETEWLLTVIAVLFASAALVLSWRSHRNVLIIRWLSLGIAGLLSARVLEGQAHHGAHHADAIENNHHDTSPHANAPDHETHVTTPHNEIHAETEHTEAEAHGDGHMEIEFLSISAGILIAIGHLSNLAVIRRTRKDALAAGGCSTS
jgi:hypothetical protein